VDGRICIFEKLISRVRTKNILMHQSKSKSCHQSVEEDLFFLEKRNGKKIICSSMRQRHYSQYRNCNDYSQECCLLAENGGHIDISKSWATCFSERLNMVKRKGRTAVKLLPTDFEKVKKQFLLDICSTDVMIFLKNSTLIESKVCSSLRLDICRKGIQVN